MLHSRFKASLGQWNLVSKGGGEGMKREGMKEGRRNGERKERKEEGKEGGKSTKGRKTEGEKKKSKDLFFK